MKVKITIICDKELPVQNLLDRDRFQIFSTKEDPDVFLMIGKETALDTGTKILWKEGSGTIHQ